MRKYVENTLSYFCLLKIPKIVNLFFPRLMGLEGKIFLFWRERYTQKKKGRFFYVRTDMSYRPSIASTLINIQRVKATCR